AAQVPWPLWFTNINTPGWADRTGKMDDRRGGRLGPLPASWLKYHGHYLHRDRVILKYEVQGREVLEMPEAEKHGDRIVLARTFWIAAGKSAIKLLAVNGVDDKDLVVAKSRAPYVEEIHQYPISEGKWFNFGVLYNVNQAEVQTTGVA